MLILLTRFKNRFLMEDSILVKSVIEISQLVIRTGVKISLRCIE